MADWTGRLGGLTLFSSANAEAIGVGASYQGGAWRGLQKRVLAPALRQLAGRSNRRGRVAVDERPRFIGARAAPANPTPEQQRILARIDGIEFYHTIELGHGIRTSGAFDHHPFLHHYRLPDRLDGQRVLDVATFDGFWAFQMEQRGAREVVAVDIGSFRQLDLPATRRHVMTDAELDAPTGAGFRAAHEVLGSRVRRKIVSVYDLAPEYLGSFDTVFLSDLLLHLQNPIRALERIRSVTRGRAIIAEVVAPELDRFGGTPVMQYTGGVGLCYWWRFSVAALERMVRDAGFSRVERVHEFRTGHTWEKPHMAHLLLHAYP